MLKTVAANIFMETGEFGVGMIVFKYMNTFIQQGCIQLIKSNSKDIYNVRNK